MSNTQLTEENIYNRNLISEEHNLQENSESFTIGSEEAAQILGVNRSRLSQLTSKGIFLFERRKIDTRNRLFYRLSDLLNHQRSQMHGNSYEYLETSTLDSKSTLKSEKIIEETQSSQVNIPPKKILLTLKNKNQKTTEFNHKATELFLQSEKRKEERSVVLNIELMKEKIFKQEEELNNLKALINKEETIFTQKIADNNSKLNKVLNTNFSIQSKINTIKNSNEELDLKLDELFNCFKKQKNWKIKKPKYRTPLAARR
ncbi:hypothetical protein [Fluviispira multicolorata]|uniref:Helix-turn-helix domain-containing protein n=1 Tax=Fluviispira multicolorata TaxID=2654512 RepID=A0A833JHH1_9BACT|nr:hypothetical protein [Fluviispira multicolorata]KAB8033508.1 hypothetical protein GCL57_02045 [Fluviispira multicolorata]